VTPVTLYDLKPAFQDLLRPTARRLAEGGVTANQVTLTAAAGSLVVGALLCLPLAQPALFLLLPAWLLARMALNALDGLMAREFGQQSPLGGYLNELGDVVSDAALLLPFAFVAPFSPLVVAGVIFLAAISEYAGAIGPLVGTARRYDGPLGKSDRAAVLGGLGLWIGGGLALPSWIAWLMPALAALLIVTTVNRVRRGLVQA
jgi:CDP-diacylglycerol--glycerol-3-phosphate 3-phosphatidyltransferase